jgi:hypothetical protein
MHAVRSSADKTGSAEGLSSPSALCVSTDSCKNQIRMTPVSFFGAALPQHAFQKLLHVPDLFVARGFARFYKRFTILIIQGTLEEVHFAGSQFLDEYVEILLGVRR